MSATQSEFRPPRRLRVFAFDPSTGRKAGNRAAREVTISIPYEMDPQPYDQPFIGPSGTYVEVVDIDPASDATYTPVDLNEDKVLFNDGLTPTADNPQFHQQMVYAVVMNTIAVFEEALGRVVQWAPDKYSKTETGEDGTEKTTWHEEFTEKLRLYPHALREANAFYNPAKKSLLFGYFNAPASADGPPAGTTIFTCLSHDIIVHETVHAILDGMHPHFAENSNPDMRALHEAFADIIALFQMFSYPSVLEDQIAKTKGDLSKQNMLGELAQEFGKALGRGHALRNFLGATDEHGNWQPLEPDPTRFYEAEGAHARGSVLVAAVFRAFLTIYKTRVADLFRIASNGSGVLRQGEIDPDLKKRLAAEAAQCARRVMRICIRAMDYVPPVNLDFGAYLRAILTADHDLFPDDKQGYRDAFLEAFASWGILPRQLPVLSIDAMIWPTLTEASEDRIARILLNDPTHDVAPYVVDRERIQGQLGVMLENPRWVLSQIGSGRAMSEEMSVAINRERHIELAEQVKSHGENIAQLLDNELKRLHRKSVVEERGQSRPKISWHSLNTNLLEIGGMRNRLIEYHASSYYKRLLWLVLNTYGTQNLADLIGIETRPDCVPTVRRSSTTGLPSLHVHSVRIAKRIGQRGQLEHEYVIELIQTRRGYLDPEEQADEDVRPPSSADNYRPHDFKYRAGTTFLIDARTYEIRRLIRTPYTITDEAGLEAHRAHLDGEAARPNNAFFEGNSAGAEAAFTDLHRSEDKKDHFG